MEIISEDKDICNTFNEFFKDAVTSLGIHDNPYLKTDPGDLTDPVEIALKKFDMHPSIVEIKDNVTPTEFNFS